MNNTFVQSSILTDNVCRVGMTKKTIINWCIPDKGMYCAFCNRLICHQNTKICVGDGCRYCGAKIIRLLKML